MKAIRHLARRIAAAWRMAKRKPLCLVAASAELEPWTDADRQTWRAFIEQTGTGRKLRVRLYAETCSEALNPAERTAHAWGRVAGMSEILWTLDELAAVRAEDDGTVERPQRD